MNEVPVIFVFFFLLFFIYEINSMRVKRKDLSISLILMINTLYEKK